MFDKLKGRFETYSASSLHHKDETLRSIEVKMGQARAAEEVIKLLEQLKYKTIKYNDTFYEIFTSKAGFEVTCRFVSGNQGGTTIDVEVYAPTHRGQTRKALRYLLHTIKEKLTNQYV